MPVTYSANDASVADVDGDGEYEMILKWEPSNAHDNSQAGFTSSVFIDCYRLDGTRLWRINLGRNIRAGAHFTQFLAYDFDGDGRAEVMMKTADGTIDGTGRTIGDPKADWRNQEVGTARYGRVMSGPEYLTVFNGLTGAAMKTVDYVPDTSIPKPSSRSSALPSRRANRKPMTSAESIGSTKPPTKNNSASEPTWNTHETDSTEASSQARSASEQKSPPTPFSPAST